MSCDDGIAFAESNINTRASTNRVLLFTGNIISILSAKAAVSAILESAYSSSATWLSHCSSTGLLFPVDSDIGVCRWSPQLH